MTITAPLLAPRRYCEVVTIDGVRWRVVRMIDRHLAVLARIVTRPAPRVVPVPVARFEQKPTVTRFSILVLAAWRTHNRKAQP